MARKRKKKRVDKKKKLDEEWLEEPMSDENFAFIAGYTSGGFPFGITHEEAEEMEDFKEIFGRASSPSIEDEDLPF